ncbi:MAG: DUF6776 family protein [Pseudomonadota bacterium]
MAHYHVRHHDPRQHKIRWAVIVTVSLAVAAGVFAGGYFYAGYHNVSLAEEVGELRDTVDELQSQRALLRQRAAMAERASEADRAATESARQALAQLQGELVELREELVFYQSLLSPGEREPGLHVNSVDVYPAEEPGRYRYQLILIQVRGNSLFASGEVRVGVAAGDPAGEESEGAGELEVVLDSQSFRYKFFQRVEGEFEWSESIPPVALTVQLDPSGRRLDDVAGVYPWADIFRGK